MAGKARSLSNERWLKRALGAALNRDRSIESLNRLENLCKLAATDTAVSLSDFDTDVMLLAAPNQWIDVKSGAAYDPDPSKLVSKTIATDYCSRSICPNFEAFVCDIFEGDQDLISYVQFDHDV